MWLQVGDDVVFERADLEDRCVGTERKRLLGSGKRQAVTTKLSGVHSEVLLTQAADHTA